MAIPPEWLLALALIAIYVLDSVQFLRIGEAVVTTGGGIPSGLSFGSALELGGRRPFLPNPLTPGRPELRVDWSTSAQGSQAQQVAAEMRQQLAVVRPIGCIAALCASLIVVLAPLALVSGHERIFVLVVLLSLLCAVAGCALVFLRRRELGLSLGQAVALCAVALVCLPCSGNLARAAAGHRRWTVRASELAALGMDRRSVVDGQVRDMLTRAQRLLVEESVEYRSVAAELKRLEARADEPH